MKLLLDTHVLVWLVEGVTRLSPKARVAIDKAATSAGIFVSAISFWEVAMLQQRGRLSLTMAVSEWRHQVLNGRGIVELPVDGDIAIEAVALPGELHADPADRLLVASARVHGCRLATHDARLLRYADAGHVQVLRV